MRILLVCDKLSWSYHSIAQALVKHNTDPNLHLDVMALKGREREFSSRQASYDRCLIMGHQMLGGLVNIFGRIPPHWLTGIHSSHAYDPDLETSPDYDLPPPKWLLRLLRKFHAVNCVSQRLFDLFSGKGLNLYLTQNGVDTELFKPTSPISTDGPLRVGVAYTPKGIHNNRKGVDEFIRPACEQVGAVLVEAKARSDKHVEHQNMPAFMNSIDCFAVGSSSEGFSVAMLEAASCGRPIISTRVGGSTELIQAGKNGVLVDRTVDAFAKVFSVLQEHRTYAVSMGAESRRIVEQEWSWEKRALAWLSFLRS